MSQSTAWLRKILRFSLPLAGYLGLAPTLLAMDAGGFEEHAAHTHGTAILTVIVAAERVVVGFESPAFNLVGFESTPETDQQKQALEAAYELLANPVTLLSFGGGACDVLDSDISLAGMDDAQSHEHIHHADHAGPGQPDSVHAGPQHAEVLVNFQLSCPSLDSPPNITVTIFSHFPGVETVQLLWATDTHQGASDLIAGRNTATLR
ncbi:MAG: DUF2796 domain-containing protein [Gammaproteobacteria bacterium]|nr:DUF2796 domain-containing protein [Gammaproteobacteria bacterium]